MSTVVWSSCFFFPAAVLFVVVFSRLHCVTCWSMRCAWHCCSSCDTSALSACSCVRDGDFSRTALFAVRKCHHCTSCSSTQRGNPSSNQPFIEDIHFQHCCASLLAHHHSSFLQTDEAHYLTATSHNAPQTKSRTEVLWGRPRTCVSAKTVSTYSIWIMHRAGFRILRAEAGWFTFLWGNKSIKCRDVMCLCEQMLMQ